MGLDWNLTDDPDILVGFVCGRLSPKGAITARGIIGEVRYTLLFGKRAEMLARRWGFVNAEHEALAFLISERFRNFIQAILAGDPLGYNTRQGVPETPRDYAQALLDQRYGGSVIMDVEPGEGPSPLRRTYPKPHDRKEYPPIGGNGSGTVTVLEILAAYDDIIRQEELQNSLPEEVKHCSVRTTGTDDPIFHNCRPHRSQRRSRRSLQPQLA